MRLVRVGVYGLFNRFNHQLEFSSTEPVTIMIGPNGFGKTMILRILNGLFNSPLKSLEVLPFRRVDVVFDDSSSITVERISPRETSERQSDRRIVQLTYSPVTGRPKQVTSEEAQITEEDLSFPVNVIADLIPNLDQIGPSQWQDLGTGEFLDLDDVVVNYWEQLPERPGFHNNELGLLRELRQLMPVRFIGIERLTVSPPRETRRFGTVRHSRNISPQRTVRRYSNDLAERVRSTLTEYATLSQALDRTFPVRLVQEPSSAAISAPELRQQLTEVEEKRSQLVEAGLLGQEQEGLSVPNIQTVDEARMSVLAVYVQDAIRKLSVFDDLYARVKAFRRIANSRLLYKQVTTTAQGLKVEAVDGSELDLEMLSTGEQHELVLLYDLLFGVERNSLIMIDEPELSLHVAWQEGLLSDLYEMALLSDFRVLLATHSPQIIGDRWDLAVELKGPVDR